MHVDNDHNTKHSKGRGLSNAVLKIDTGFAKITDDYCVSCKMFRNVSAKCFEKAILDLKENF